MLPVLLAAAVAAPPAANPYFAITVTDEQTGRGVPLVRLRTTNEVAYYTDSNGVVAFHEPGLEGRDVFFHVSAHGYEFPKDGFGFRGVKLRVTPGGSAAIKVKRTNIAERLYRVTGGGIYRDSLLAGVKVPLKEPALNGRVFGSDSVLNAVYRGKVFWVWGDTNQPAYPLGTFEVPGATSELPGNGGLDPDAGVDLTYFTDPTTGFARPTARMPGKGPTWITALAALPGDDGRERLCASFVKVEPPLKVYARGVAEFDDAKREFVRRAEVPMTAAVFPDGHAVRYTDGGAEYILFAHPFPVVRAKATADAFLRGDGYESFTCLKDGTRPAAGQLDRGGDGRPRYAWRANTPPLSPDDERKLVAAGKLKADEVRWRLRDRDTGKWVTPHAGSVYWNEYRRRWVMITSEVGGTSYLGETWYAEAATPVGPWRYAVKVVSHDRYSFYNPKQHPMFDKDGGRFVYFEGTYTHTFSGNPHPTPRYDYNQVMYNLDLSDPRTVLPVPVYSEGKLPERFTTAAPAGSPRPAFYAPDRARPGTIPVLADGNGLLLGQAGDDGAVFHALPVDAADAPATVSLYEYRERGGTRRTYSADPAAKFDGFDRAESALCRVWRAD